MAAVILVSLAILLGGLVLLRLPDATPTPSTSPVASGSQPPATPRPGDATVRAYPGTPLLPGPPVEPVGRSTQSRLWSVEGTWYGIAVDPGTRESRISVLSRDGSRWTDTGVVVDERPGAMVDALWDGQRLITISAVPGRSTDHGVRIVRFHQDDSGPFVRDPNFPVPLTERGVGAATIARDAAGRLWAAFVQDGAVLVAHSTTDDAIWSVPTALPGSGSVAEDDLAAVVATGDDRVAVAWSEGRANSVRVAFRADAAPLDAWETPEVAFDDLPLAPRPISVAAAGGTVAIGIQTAVSASEAGSSDPDSLITVRDPSGAWRTALTSRIGDRLGSPVVVLDEAAGDVYAFLTSPRRAGAVYLKRSPIDRLDFPAGRGLLVIDDPSTPPAVTSVTSAKSPVALADAFVIQGLDEATGVPWHAIVGPPGEAPTPSPGGGSTSPTPAPAPTTDVRLLIDDDFDPWAEGEPITNGWEIGPADAQGTLVAGGAPDERHAVLRSSTASAVRACKPFPPTTAGDLVVDVVVQADALGDGDVVITSVRSGPSEAVSVRFGQGGTFAFYAGETKVRTTVRNRLGERLRSRVTVHLDTGTYDWRLTADDGTVIVSERDIPFRERVDAASSVCIGTSTGPDRPVVRYDDVRVAH